MREWTYKVVGQGKMMPIPGNQDYIPTIVLRGTVEAENVGTARVIARRHCESVCGVINAVVLDCTLKYRTVE